MNGTGRFIEYLKCGSELLVLELRVGDVLEDPSQERAGGNKWFLLEYWKELYGILNKAALDHLQTGKIMSKASTVVGNQIEVTFQFKPFLAAYQHILSPFKCEPGNLAEALADPGPEWMCVKPYRSMLVAAVLPREDRFNVSLDLFTADDSLDAAVSDSREDAYTAQVVSESDSEEPPVNNKTPLYDIKYNQSPSPASHNNDGKVFDTLSIHRPNSGLSMEAPSSPAGLPPSPQSSFDSTFPPSPQSSFDRTFPPLKKKPASLPPSPQSSFDRTFPPSPNSSFDRTFSPLKKKPASLPPSTNSSFDRIFPPLKKKPSTASTVSCSSLLSGTKTLPQSTVEQCSPLLSLNCRSSPLDALFSPPSSLNRLSVSSGRQSSSPSVIGVSPRTPSNRLYLNPQSPSSPMDRKLNSPSNRLYLNPQSLSSTLNRELSPSVPQASHQSSSPPSLELFVNHQTKFTGRESPPSSPLFPSISKQHGSPPSLDENNSSVSSTLQKLFAHSSPEVTSNYTSETNNNYNEEDDFLQKQENVSESKSTSVMSKLLTGSVGVVRGKQTDLLTKQKFPDDSVNGSDSRDSRYPACKAINKSVPRSCQHVELLSPEAASKTPCTQTKLMSQFVLPVSHSFDPDLLGNAKRNHSYSHEESETEALTGQQSPTLVSTYRSQYRNSVPVKKELLESDLAEEQVVIQNKVRKKRKLYSANKSDIPLLIDDTEGTRTRKSSRITNIKNKESSLKSAKLIDVDIAPKITKNSTCTSISISTGNINSNLSVGQSTSNNFDTCIMYGPSTSSLATSNSSHQVAEILEIVDSDDSANDVPGLSDADTILLGQRQFLRSLTTNFVTKQFRKHAAFIHEIAQNRLACERHEQYLKDVHARNELMDSPALSQVHHNIAFHLMTLMIDTFCKNNPFESQDYMWKVSLPELINKIFMEKYNLNHEESVKRLREIQLFNAPGDVDDPDETLHFVI